MVGLYKYQNEYIVIGDKKKIYEYGFLCLIIILTALFYVSYLCLYFLKLVFFDNFIYDLLYILYYCLYYCLSSWINYFNSLYETRWIINIVRVVLLTYIYKKVKRQYKLTKEIRLLKEQIIFDTFKKQNIIEKREYTKLKYK